MATIELPPDMPASMQGLERDEVGRPVPFFVATVNGKPDFRVMDPVAFRACIMRDLCWVCGQKLDKIAGSSYYKGTFVAGPMCLINRNSAEPPSHRRCAEWSAKACPFLVNPNKVRREANMPEETRGMAGIPVLRNPGVTGCLNSRRWHAENVGNGILFFIDGLESVHWFREGREATGAEVLESIESGLPALVALAEEEGEKSVRSLATRLQHALRYVPDEASVTGYMNIEQLLTHMKGTTPWQTTE